MGVWPLKKDDCYLKALVGALKRAPSKAAVLYLVDVRATPPRLVPQGARGTHMPDAIHLDDNPVGESFLLQKVVGRGHNGDAHGLSVPFKNGALYLGRPTAYSREEKRQVRRWARQVEGGIRNASVYLRAVQEQMHDNETGVFNREYLDQRVEEEYKRSERFGCELSMVSIQAPPKDLKGSAQSLLSAALDTDLVAHLGNGHFAVLLIEAPRERVEHFVSQVGALADMRVKEVVTYDRAGQN
ncbi:MAG TPA: hypothetical protein VGO93_14685 [Candidatus Xenobia bacterium]|jgi:GGDEF domain-containing protein